MKKILLVLVSCLLIACMAGSALANPATVVIDQQPITIVPNNNDISTATVKIIDITTQLNPPYQRTICLHTNSNNVHARIVGNGVDITTVSAGTDVKGTYTYTGSTPTFTLEVWGTEATTLVVTDYATIDNNGVPEQFDVGVGTRDVNIPEFPTVALPVAAILGLVFVFGRKK